MFSCVVTTHSRTTTVRRYDNKIIKIKLLTAKRVVTTYVACVKDMNSTSISNATSPRNGSCLFSA
ncbi:hypothetical protein AB7M18_002755 [Pseudomonas viridiflava]